MWYEVFKFELEYRLKRPDTYIFFIFLWVFSTIGIDFVFSGVDLGQVKKNAPILIAKTMGVICGISMFISSMIMGVTVLRDFEYDIASLLYSNPITKRDYLVGRFLGAFVILLFVFSGVLLGMCVGEFLPWHKPEEMLPFNFMAYLQAFIFIGLPIVFLGSALFFVTGALSKKLIVVYTQGLVFFVLFVLINSIENSSIQALLDPFSLNTLNEDTKFWSAIQKNTQLVSISGFLLYNKLLWMSIAAVILGIGYYKFSFSIIQTKTRKQKRKQLNYETEQNKTYEDIKILKATKEYGMLAWCIQLVEHTLFHFKAIIKETSFKAIAICGMIIILVNSVSLGTSYGVDSYPTTYLIVEELREMALYFFLIILLFYSAELFWKERSVHLNLIYDALPISNFLNLVSKYLSLLLIYALLMFVLIGTGVLFQTWNGYYNFELEVYCYGFFLELFPFLALYTFISFFLQAIINNKYVGIIAMVFFFAISLVLEFFGYTHSLYKFGGNPIGAYSDMNGYGHFLKPYLWVKLYWTLLGVLLLVFSSIISVRGTETSLLKRWKIRGQQFSNSFRKFTLAIALGVIFVGSYIFYNTNILNEYWTNDHELEFRAGYENALKKYEYLPQPKITDVYLNIDLYPEKRSYEASGYYVITNLHSESIKEVHVQKRIDSQVKLEEVVFNVETIKNNTYAEYDYTIYQLSKPLEPGESIKMYFKQLFAPKGFEEGGSTTEILHNGTFFNNKVLPTFGYNNKYELRHIDDRKKFNLANRVYKKNIDNPNELVNARTGSDSKGVRLDITLNTSANQSTIVPGNLIRRWEENNRNYFHYRTEKPIINFYGIVSAEYEVLKDTWQAKEEEDNVDLEIYYHKGHEYNLARMMEGMKHSLSYFTVHFGAYQYQQMRIMEFPRYRKFAQSFPNTIPFSEALGFILDINDEKDVDMAFYVTAHEMAHQWWGLQIEAANVKGQSMILETLAQYSAIMVFEKRYGKGKTRQFLKLCSENYFNGKLQDKNMEVPLVLVENQDYLYYDKGALAMYALQDYIGEDKVNLALRNFINDWKSFNNPIKPERYATSKDLIGYFRTVTPDEFQQVITDLFETTTTYTTRISEASLEELSDSSYKVELLIEMQKSHINELGNKELVPLNDWIDVEINDEEGKTNYFKQHKISQEETMFEIFLDKKPSVISIDPMYKLIEKNKTDNVWNLNRE
ncbi:Peptidase M1 [Tenacibaculum sp. 190130A14a]|uniref:ABC-2 type transport system permease protein n=1 Tax=Tenacibaculum polynesiense TaxID=3137857 RepID=A0ABM9P7A1_9FLAO